MHIKQLLYIAARSCKAISRNAQEAAQNLLNSQEHNELAAILLCSTLGIGIVIVANMANI
jgi:hypothetical protein